jgi:hypothetical protein
LKINTGSASVEGVFMKFHTLWVTFVALSLSACGPQEQAEPQQPESDQAAEETSVAESAFNETVLTHMHAHAEKFDDLMFALADDDLERARTPAYWLSQHEVVEGIPEEWRYFVTGMHNAAYEVETAEDLATARAAAEEISAQCQGCHTAAGVSALE